MTRVARNVLAATCVVVALQGCGAEPGTTDPNPVCGDGTCHLGPEDGATCPEDCEAECGNGACEAPLELAPTCQADCQVAGVCGNLTCEPGEDVRSCGWDCTDCGDGSCNLTWESALTCAADCPPKCGDDACTHGESSDTCPRDCPPETVCGDGSCEWGETPTGCPGDCEAWCDEIGWPERAGKGCSSSDDCDEWSRCVDDETWGGLCRELCYPGECESGCSRECIPIMDADGEYIEVRPGITEGYCRY